MVILQDKAYIKLTFIIFFYLLIGCGNNSITKIERFCGFKVGENLILIEKQENWNEFNGDGYKYKVYKVERLIDSIDEKAIENGFKKFNSNIENPFSKSEFNSQTKNSIGFYKTQWEEQKTTTVVIDTINQKIIYYYSLM